MNMQRLIVATAVAVLLGGSRPVFAQTPPPGAAPPPPPPGGTTSHHHTHTTAGSTVPIPGGIIGNKRTHVYHMPGDTSSLPSEKNRVYFHNEAEAIAAHYHAPKKHGASHTSTHGKAPHSPHTQTPPPGSPPPNTAPPPPPQ